MIRFNQDFSKNKIKQGDYYTVGQLTQRHRDENILPLINEQGKNLIFPLKNLPQYKTHTAAFERVIEVYQAQALPLKVGDQVMWTRNFKADNLRNGQRAVLKAQDEKTLVFSFDQGKEITLNKDHVALKHIDYGYVFTNYKVQGKDAARGVGLMESHQRFSATLKNFYVQISRGVLGITLVTDDKEALAKAIEKNPDEKKASLDMISSKQLIEHNLRFQDKSRLSIQPVINIKIERESMINDLSFSKANANKNQSEMTFHTTKKPTLIKELERT